MPDSKDDDDKFFQKKMQGVKRLQTSKKIAKQKSPLKPRRLKQPQYELPSDEFPFTDHLSEVVTAETKLFFARPGLQQKVLKSFRLGEIKQREILDLHGSSVTEARSAVSEFLSHCIGHGERCVRIIHGKGKFDLDPPILKNQINNWLRQHPAVLAFSSATTKDGGNGAVYVLLKRKMKDEF